MGLQGAKTRLAEASPTGRAAQRRTRERLAAGVVRREEPYRSAMLRRFYDGLPPRDIAESRGSPSRR
jgi:DNA-directed RNA polymerase specialized sigma24 family protein